MTMCGKEDRNKDATGELCYSAGRPNFRGALFRPAQSHAATARGVSIRSRPRATAAT